MINAFLCTISHHTAVATFDCFKTFSSSMNITGTTPGLKKHLASLDDLNKVPAERLNVVKKTEELLHVGDLINNASKYIRTTTAEMRQFCLLKPYANDLDCIAEKLMVGKKVIESAAMNLSGFKRSGRAHGKIRKERKRKIMASIRQDHTMKKKSRIMQEIYYFTSAISPSIARNNKPGKNPVVTKSTTRRGKYKAPRPQVGFTYTPAEAIGILLDAERSGCGRRAMRAMKKEMIEKQYIPIKMSALNEKLKRHREGSLPMPE